MKIETLSRRKPYPHMIIEKTIINITIGIIALHDHANHSNHLSNLMIDKALAYQRKSDKFKRTIIMSNGLNIN
jgi:hypothetical protein